MAFARGCEDVIAKLAGYFSDMLRKGRLDILSVQVGDLSKETYLTQISLREGSLMS